MPETIIVTRPAPKVVCVTLNRPHVRNALSTQMGRELIKFFEDDVEEMGDDCRCIIVTGAEDKAFCAGADLKERKGMSDDAWLRQHRIFERKLRAILECPVPVIAAVNGAAYAGGCELVLATDFAFAVPEARFALTEVSLGIMPGGGGTQTLPRAIGSRRAKEVIFRAKPFSAAEALSWGLVNALYPQESLLREVVAIASDVTANAPRSIRQAKSSVNNGLQMDLRTGLRFEIEAYNQLVFTKDRLEGINAFNERRKPDFRGE